VKAIIYRQYGGPEVLELAEVPDPKLAQNSVLIRVKAAALNPADHVLQVALETRSWTPGFQSFLAGTLRASSNRLAQA
jgi:NADPH:quinone reductase-like Zn-dependent oxidoreductase